MFQSFLRSMCMVKNELIVHVSNASHMAAILIKPFSSTVSEYVKSWIFRTPAPILLKLANGSFVTCVLHSLFLKNTTPVTQLRINSIFKAINK